MTTEGRVAFAVGTGRCGTYMAYELLRRNPAVAASHERSVFAECFHRYCVWYGLPVDDEAFIRTKAGEIAADLQTHRYSFEASAPLSFSIPVLHRAFAAKFVLFVRDPIDVVNSYLSKGWFVEDIEWRDRNCAPGYHPWHQQPHHSFGRLMPLGAAYAEWSGMGRIGKLAWTWATVNRAVVNAFSALPAGQSMIFRLEDFDYEAYRRMTAFLGYELHLGRAEFEAVTGSRPNARRNKPTVGDWSRRDAEEFLAQAGDAASEFDYVFDLADAGKGNNQAGAPRQRIPSLPVRFRRGMSGAIAEFKRQWQRPAD